MFQAKQAEILDQQNKIQEVVIAASDLGLYKIDTSNVCVTIGEQLVRVVSVLFHDNSAATLTSQVAANIVLVDSVALTTGGDKKALRLTAVPALDANDHIIVRYQTVK